MKFLILQHIHIYHNKKDAPTNDKSVKIVNNLYHLGIILFSIKIDQQDTMKITYFSFPVGCLACYNGNGSTKWASPYICLLYKFFHKDFWDKKNEKEKWNKFFHKLKLGETQVKQN